MLRAYFHERKRPQTRVLLAVRVSDMTGSCPPLPRSATWRFPQLYAQGSNGWLSVASDVNQHWQNFSRRAPCLAGQTCGANSSSAVCAALLGVSIRGTALRASLSQANRSSGRQHLRVLCLRPEPQLSGYAKAAPYALMRAIFQLMVLEFCRHRLQLPPTSHLLRFLTAPQLVARMPRWREELQGPLGFRSLCCLQVDSVVTLAQHTELGEIFSYYRRSNHNSVVCAPSVAQPCSPCSASGLQGECLLVAPTG